MIMIPNLDKVKAAFDLINSDTELQQLNRQCSHYWNQGMETKYLETCLKIEQRELELGIKNYHGFPYIFQNNEK